MLDSSDELVDPSAASLSHPEKQINDIADAAFHTEPVQKKNGREAYFNFCTWSER